MTGFLVVIRPEPGFVGSASTRGIAAADMRVLVRNMILMIVFMMTTILVDRWSTAECSIVGSWTRR